MIWWPYFLFCLFCSGPYIQGRAQNFSNLCFQDSLLMLHCLVRTELFWQCSKQVPSCIPILTFWFWSFFLVLCRAGFDATNAFDCCLVIFSCVCLCLCGHFSETEWCVCVSPCPFNILCRAGFDITNAFNCYLYEPLITPSTLSYIALQGRGLFVARSFHSVLLSVFFIIHSFLIEAHLKNTRISGPER